MNVEERFVTRDRDSRGEEVVFNMFEDEDGCKFWGYGHQDPQEFLAEVHRWVDHCDLTEDQQVEKFDWAGSVEHLWARFTDDERFKIEDRPWLKTKEEVNSLELFPVTRMLL